MRVLVLGGDGFCGWPTSLYLSDRGYDVTILDNLSRRKIDIDLEVGSLTPIRAIGDRLRAWREVSGRGIDFINLDLATEYDRLIALLRELRPDAIVHFAEQRAAPYSMRSPATKRYTVDNNVRATHNLLAALVHTRVDAAIAHLGTMGVYGYGWSGSAPIPEGYLTVKVPTPAGELEREILHPANPGSVYHMTKTLDQLMFAFYAKNDGLRITDLHQGIVWGTQTDQTALDERLINRFDYDGDYGTVLNRFLMQAAIGHPLTVHGTGGQTRAFIHIKDTVRASRSPSPIRPSRATGRWCSTRSPRHTGSSTSPSWSPTPPAGRSRSCRTRGSRRRRTTWPSATTISSRSACGPPRCRRGCSPRSGRSPPSTRTAPIRARSSPGRYGGPACHAPATSSPCGYPRHQTTGRLTSGCPGGLTQARRLTGRRLGALRESRSRRIRTNGSFAPRTAPRRLRDYRGTPLR